jgi:hypothetical protein
MENEFDFFNNLNFGTDFTKQGLGGYGTYTDQYTTPVDTGDPNPVLIESPTGVETIPAPITPFINQGSGDGNNGITTLAQDYGYNSVFDNTNITPTRPDGTLQPQTNFEYDIEEGSIPQSDIDNLETAKNDTNVNNLINMGLVDKAKEYVKNNYGYMIMNLIFPGSGYAAKAFVETKKKKQQIIKDKEDAARRVEEENILLDKQNALIASKKAEEAAFQATLNQQQERQRRADLERIERAYRQDTGSGGGSYAPGGGSGSHAPDASGSTYSDPFDPGGGEKDGGHIDGTNRRRYGTGGIVSL